MAGPSHGSKMCAPEWRCGGLLDKNGGKKRTNHHHVLRGQNTVSLATLVQI